jgi:hypothetical protein
MDGVHSGTARTAPIMKIQIITCNMTVEACAQVLFMPITDTR